MFDAHGTLTLGASHVDFSYSRPEGWLPMTPSGSIKPHVIDLGGDVAGPVIQVGIIKPIEGEALDWRHSVDPLHFHGSDQFRTTVEGDWVLAGRKVPSGTFSLQEAGIVYQESPAGDGAAKVFLVMGDRRGA